MAISANGSNCLLIVKVTSIKYSLQSPLSPGPITSLNYTFLQMIRVSIFNFSLLINSEKNSFRMKYTCRPAHCKHSLIIFRSVFFACVFCFATENEMLMHAACCKFSKRKIQAKEANCCTTTTPTTAQPSEHKTKTNGFAAGHACDNDTCE